MWYRNRRDAFVFLVLALAIAAFLSLFPLRGEVWWIRWVAVPLVMLVCWGTRP